jgi:hypothetical protein
MFGADVNRLGVQSIWVDLISDEPQ